MAEDHIAGLVEAIDAHDDEKAKYHLAGLAHDVMSLLNRAVEALEAAGAR